MSSAKPVPRWLLSAALISIFAWSSSSAVASSPPDPSPDPSPDPTPDQSPAAAESGVIKGVIKNQLTSQPIENAAVVLSCTCLSGMRETMTNARGIYSFTDLPSGTYTIQVLAGKANVSKITELPHGAKFRANFSINPEQDQVIEIVVEASPVASSAAAMTMRMEEARQLPVGSSASRDFMAVVDIPGSRYKPERHRPERYGEINENKAHKTKKQPISTFSIDVDTASYSNVRRFLSTQAELPPADAVRTEELINYFSYDYPQPAGDAAFTASVEIADCPWNRKARLLHIGVQGKAMPPAQLPPRNLVFLIDVSGSMQSPDKLPLLLAGMKLLVETLEARDHVAIVVYAGNSGVILPPTSGGDRKAINAALDQLSAGGSTNGAAGIEQAYALARQHFDANAINRVILATDGDFNVGTVDAEALQALIERERESGVFLSVLGFGTGNLQDVTMEMLADKGNGNYAYIDSLGEANKVLVQEGGATLVTIAKDVKIQIEFDPTQVAKYRLVGYENRVLANEDFADDRKDAGEIGAGHSVTALYEFVPSKHANPSRPIAELRLRHKQPTGFVSRQTTAVIHDLGATLAHSSDNFRFAAAVAEFGMLLRKSKHARKASWEQARELANGALGRDPHGYRREFLDLLGRAESLSRRRR